ncbi:MAG: integrase [Pseudohongiellaceae bacterium]|jgi:integrase
MGNIRARKENGKLLLDFHFHGVRFREQTALPDNQQNRKKVQALLDRVEARIKLGEFNYSEFFPGSKNIQKFLEVDPSQAGENQIQSLRVQPASVATKIAAKAPLFESFARQWQTEKKIEWRASHARNIESVLSNSLIKFFGKRVLSDITKAEILEFRSKLASKPGRGGKEQIAAKTINTHMALLNAILEEASDRYSFENPYKNIKPLKLQRTHVEPFSLIEVNRIIESVRADYRNYYAVRFYSGMRTGEIDGLRWEFVDFKRGLIAIRETLVQGKTEYTKTDGSQRDIPMLGPVKAALEAQYLATGKLSPYVFCNTEGKPLDHNNITKRVWYPLLRHLGLKMRRPYQTRHTAATLLLASGENPEWVARFLGHASTEMLFKVYSRYIPNLTRQDGSAFEQMLGVQEERVDN